MHTIGKFQILAELGRGAMGVVYKALDPDINRVVAIKAIHYGTASQKADTDAMLKRFLVEARAVGSLNHPNIVTVYEVLREDDHAYIVMQYVEGRSLKEIIGTAPPLAPEEGLRLVLTLCDALQYAHEKGVIHRDIKPANILIDERGRPFLLDFGIAKLESSELTQTGTALGTPSYMSPEQITGKTPLDHRTDIFSLGAVWYELVRWEKAFGGDTITTVIHKVLHEEPAFLPDRGRQVPVAMEPILKQALAKNVEERFQSCREMAGAIRTLLNTDDDTTLVVRQEPAALMASRLDSVASLLRRHGRRTWLIALPLLALLAWILIRNGLFAPTEYDHLVAIAQFVYPSSPSELDRPVEFILQRALTAHSDLPVIAGKDFQNYSETPVEQRNEPQVLIEGQVKQELTGLEIALTVRDGDDETAQTFYSKGWSDFLSNTSDQMIHFIQSQAPETRRDKGSTARFTDISTASWEAFSFYLRGRNAWSKLDIESAFRNLKSAVETDPEMAMARLKLAEVLIFRGDRDEARQELESTAARQARLTWDDQLRLQALTARLDSNPSAERQYLRKLVESFPLSREYQYEFAEACFHSADSDQAIEFYQKALALDPDYALAHNHLAYCYAWKGMHREALQHFQRYVELDHTPNAYDSLAAGYLFAGDYRQALEAARQGLALDGNLDYLYGTQATALRLMGSLSAAEKAIDHQAQLTTSDSTRQSCTINRAYLHRLRGNPDQALATVRPLVDAYENGPHRDRLDEEAILPLWLNGVLAAERNDLATLKRMSLVLARRVERHQVNAVNFFPILKFSIHLRILEAAARHDVAAVQDQIEEGLRIKAKMGYWSSPYDSSFFLTSFAQTAAKLGESALAERLLQSALETNPRNPETLLGQAEFLLAAGDRAGAGQMLDAAQDVLRDADPGIPVTQRLARLRRE